MLHRGSSTLGRYAGEDILNLESANPPRFLALGDCYTIGHGVRPDECWPAQLVAILAARHILLAYPEIVAQNSWSTAELKKALEHLALGNRFALVSLSIGVNDQYRGMERDYRKRFRSLLKRSIDCASSESGRVLVVSIPDWGVSPFAVDRDREAISAAIDRFNAVNQEETERAGSRWVDITYESRRAATEPTSFISDGLHPSAKQYAAWASLVLEPVLQALR